MPNKLTKDQRRKRKLKARSNKRRLQIVKPRSCGDCTACCTTMGVPELSKAHNSPCEHNTGTGCGIYDTRPQSCRAFECLWLQGHGLPEQRPDRLGLTLDPTVKDGPLGKAGEVIVAREVWPGSASHPRAVVFLNKLSTALPVYVMHKDGGRQIWQDGQVRKAKRPD